MCISQGLSESNEASKAFYSQGGLPSVSVEVLGLWKETQMTSAIPLMTEEFSVCEKEGV